MTESWAEQALADALCVMPHSPNTPECEWVVSTPKFNDIKIAESS